ncbi:MAG: hypothetical protein HYS05_06050 [Acidobacteria bacterium]|nr:hypothetical protein [Acidobacteriota bacterium]
MSSTFAWLDYSEEQRRKVLDVLDLFKEKSTVDELGLGTIRDAFADMLFPGTSAPQTRARYFLFVPWTYLKLEADRVPSGDVARRARREELRLIDRLLEAGETDGVIGKLAKGSLQRLPSNIYWTGLRRLDICLFNGSQDSYHKSLDAFYRRRRAGVKTDDGEVLGAAGPNWHPSLPEAPASFPEKASLGLTHREAEYLRERIAVNAPSSLFAHIANATRAGDETEYPWAHPRRDEFSITIRDQLWHGQNFSELMHGASLLYNLMLAELTPPQDSVEPYRQQLGEWAAMIGGRLPDLESWNSADFWQCVQSEGIRISLQTRAFVERWWELALNRREFEKISDLRDARELIHQRERSLKGPLARIDNQRARERWGGDSGTRRLTYRWPNAARIARDILEALEEKADA